MSECTRTTCKLSGDAIDPLESNNDRCGNCDHHSVLHNADGCTVHVQMKSGNKNEKCPCEWNTFQASSLEEVSDAKP